MYSRLAALFVCAIFVLHVTACKRQPTDSKAIQQQRSGDYVVSVSTDTGVLKQHADHVRLEFRRASTNEFANVTNVLVQPSMRMQGMAPMFGDVTSIRQVSTGVFEFDAELTMAGQWNFLVTFDPDGRVQFNLNAQ